jgi:maltodextrin utilization protein YvdJ
MEKKIHPPRIAVICIYIVTIVCRMLWLVGWVLYAWTAVTIYMTKRRRVELEDMNYNIDDDMNDEI